MSLVYALSNDMDGTDSWLSTCQQKYYVIDIYSTVSGKRPEKFHGQINHKIHQSNSHFDYMWSILLNGIEALNICVCLSNIKDTWNWSSIAARGVTCLNMQIAVSNTGARISVRIPTFCPNSIFGVYKFKAHSMACRWMPPIIRSSIFYTYSRNGCFLCNFVRQI